MFFTSPKKLFYLLELFNFLQFLFFSNFFPSNRRGITSRYVLYKLAKTIFRMKLKLLWISQVVDFSVKNILENYRKYKGRLITSPTSLVVSLMMSCKRTGFNKNSETIFMRIFDDPLTKHLFKKELLTWVVCFGLFIKIKLGSKTSF